MATKRQSYTTSEKLKIIQFAEEHGNRAAMPSNRTVSKTGEKTVKIRTTGNEKNRLTVVLTCAGDGSKLKPLVIFKRKTMPKIANKHGVVVAVQEKGWMDQNIMKIWIEKVWRSRIGGLGRRRSLLVLDSFEAHKTEQVKRSFKSEAWRDIPREMVANSFLKCGITNSLDGSEDDFIFDTSSDDESIVADDSLVTELFNDSESESDFEGF